MQNATIVEVFNEIADWLELSGETVFRVRAYQRAARAVQDLMEDIAEIAAKGDLEKIDGIGGGTAKKIEEILETGKCEYLEELRLKFPPGLRAMMRIPDFGPKKIAAVYKELGIDTVEKLEEAAREDKLSGLRGFGKKTQDNLLRGIELSRRSKGRTGLPEAAAVAEAIVQLLAKLPEVQTIVPAGSLRRGRETIGDIDILVATDNAAPIMELFTTLPPVKEVLLHGSTKSSVLTAHDLQIDLRAVPPESMGAAMQYFTGSKEHNIALRERAVKMGLSINEYNVTRIKDGKAIAGKTEEEVYKAVGLAWIPPELRENRGEIQAAEAGELPKLVELSDIKGDLHSHTTYTDGTLTIEGMALAAKSRGYQYIAITDHSKALAMTKGLDEIRLLEQVKEIQELNKKLKPFRILTGIEVDIMRDGSLDLDDEVLDQLDFVIASIHSNFRMTRDEMTARVVKAIENPVVDMIAHPTGRVLGSREPYEMDIGAVIAAAARSGTMLEINANDRLDLNDVNARAAREAGVTLVINTDAHSAGNFETMKFGVTVARRAGLEASDVLNTLPLKKLLERLGRE